MTQQELEIKLKKLDLKIPQTELEEIIKAAELIEQMINTINKKSNHDS